MPESTHHAPAVPPDPPADQDATIESLLVAGLDLYFAGEYDRAIHAWTRVLFLDRGHARARAYIDRARQVVAERQRQSDLLVHGAMDAFDGGDLPRAQALIAEALSRGAHDTQALALSERLQRLNVPDVAPPATDTTTPASRTASQHRSARPPASRWWPVAALVGAALVVMVAWPVVVEWATADRTPPPIAPIATEDAPLPVPRVSDLLIDRAQGLFSRGHLHEAAAMLETVRLDDPRRADAERLLADIQRVLLAGAGDAAAPAPATSGAGPSR